MGAISSCCKKDYAALPDGAEGSEFSGVAKDEAHVPDSYNQSLSSFTGLNVELKFTSKSGYEDKFVWLNSTSKTIHMSTHSTKEKRHKEASLADVSLYIVQRGLHSSIGPGSLRFLVTSLHYTTPH